MAKKPCYWTRAEYNALHRSLRPSADDDAIRIGSAAQAKESTNAARRKIWGEGWHLILPDRGVIGHVKAVAAYGLQVTEGPAGLPRLLAQWSRRPRSIPKGAQSFHGWTHTYAPLARLLKAHKVNGQQAWPGSAARKYQETQFPVLRFTDAKSDPPVDASNSANHPHKSEANEDRFQNWPRECNSGRFCDPSPPSLQNALLGAKIGGPKLALSGAA